MKRFPTKIRSSFIAATLALSAILAPQSYAQTETLDDLLPAPQPGAKYRGLNASVRLFDTVLVYPLPDWSPTERSSNPLKASKFNRTQKGNIFSLQMVPKEEEFKSWRNLYAIVGVANFPGNTRSHADQIIKQFRAGCRPSNLSIRPGSGNRNKAIIVIACGSYARKQDEGEIAAFVIFQHGKTAVRIYREWRGPAFQAGTSATWPVSPEEVQRVLRTMHASTLTGPK